MLNGWLYFAITPEFTFTYLDGAMRDQMHDPMLDEVVFIDHMLSESDTILMRKMLAAAQEARELREAADKEARG